MVPETPTLAAITVDSYIHLGNQAREGTGVDVAPMGQIEDDRTAKLVRCEGQGPIQDIG